MSINDRFRTSKDKELSGITIEYRNEKDEVEAWFKCKRPGGRNTEYQKVLNRKLREYRQDLAQDKDNSLQDRLIAEVFAEAVILDWGGDIEGPNGEKPPECTYENVVWLFADECPDLFESLQRRLDLRDNWQEENKRVAAKNSETASTTSSSGGSKKKSS